jgi:CRISPR/Cas system-associated endonuclease Cas1
MTKRKTRSHGPQALAAQAQYLLNQRRVKLWIPFLEARIAELQARIQEQGSSGEQAPSTEYE